VPQTAIVAHPRQGLRTKAALRAGPAAVASRPASAWREASQSPAARRAARPRVLPAVSLQLVALGAVPLRALRSSAAPRGRRGIAAGY